MRAGVLALLLASGAALADEPAVRPVGMTELDGVVHGDEAQGESGLEVARLRLGMEAAPAPWLRARGVAELVVEERPQILDAFIALRAPRFVVVTVGFDKTPMMATFHDQPVETTPLPEFGLAPRALSAGRDFGVEGHLRDAALPVEAWLRVGNGSGSALGNDDGRLAVQARLDSALGRARAGASGRERFGLRAGVGAHAEDTDDRRGIAGVTPMGFTFWRPPTVSGPVVIGGGHAVAYLGPVTLSLEGGVAREGRSRDTDGDPGTPRVALDPVRARGATAEAAWMARGAPRAPGAWPAGAGGIGVEVAARGSRLATGLGAADVDPGGIWCGEVGGRVWLPLGLAVGVAGEVSRFDAPPVETPGETLAWGVRVRLTWALLGVGAPT